MSGHPLTGPFPKSAQQTLLASLQQNLEELDAQGLRRSFRVVEEVDGVRMRVDGRDVVCFCSNDYLGLAGHPRLAEAAASAARTWGVGARASRLLSGTTAYHRDLEEGLAGWFGAESAIVFASGYLANHGALTALLGSKDTVLVDRLAHASLIDAARASGAKLRVFRHNDPEHLGQVLESVSSGKRVVVTEGVFSMDGDRAPLPALLEIARRYGAVLYLDDAHGAFATGEKGRGTPEVFGVAHDSLLYMGTLGKALGSQGGFLIGDSDWIEWLRNRARSWVYATALAIPAAAAALAALDLLQRDTTFRRQLERNAAAIFKRFEGGSALPVGAGPSHILPWITGSADSALTLASRLWDAGLWCPAIRPPTVARNTARLRISVSALHTAEQIERLAAALKER